MALVAETASVAEHIHRSRIAILSREAGVYSGGRVIEEDSQRVGSARMINAIEDQVSPTVGGADIAGRQPDRF
jgi:hypothetical protein